MKKKNRFMNKLVEISSQYRPLEGNEICLFLQAHKKNKRYIYKTLGWNNITTKQRIKSGKIFDWYGFENGSKYYQYQITHDDQTLTVSAKDGKVVSVQLDGEGLDYVFLYYEKATKVKLVIRKGLTSDDRKLIKGKGTIEP